MSTSPVPYVSFRELLDVQLIYLTVSMSFKSVPPFSDCLALHSMKSNSLMQRQKLSMIKCHTEAKVLCEYREFYRQSHSCSLVFFECSFSYSPFPCLR